MTTVKPESLAKFGSCGKEIDFAVANSAKLFHFNVIGKRNGFKISGDLIKKIIANGDYVFSGIPIDFAFSR